MYDMFYNVQLTKNEYVKAFVYGFTLALCTLFLYEYIKITFDIKLPSSVHSGGGVDNMLLPGSNPTIQPIQFRYNTGMPNF